MVSNGGLAQPMYFVHSTTSRIPHPWRFHGWAAMPMGSGGFAHADLRISGLIDQNRAFAIGAMANAS